MKYRLTLVGVLFVSLGALVLTGCPPKKKMVIEEPEIEEPELADEGEGVLKEGDIQINQEWSEIPALETIQFSYDKAQLDPTAKTVLKKNVSILKKLPNSVTVRVEGHCDDRGTIEYNIALGQRRSNVVRSYYETAGIAKNRLESVSYGEERPLCNFQNEDCWKKNRRSVTKVRNSDPLIIKGTDLAK